MGKLPIMRGINHDLTPQVYNKLRTLALSENEQSAISLARFRIGNNAMMDTVVCDGDYEDFTFSQNNQPFQMTAHTRDINHFLWCVPHGDVSLWHTHPFPYDTLPSLEDAFTFASLRNELGRAGKVLTFGIAGVDDLSVYGFEKSNKPNMSSLMRIPISVAGKRLEPLPAYGDPKREEALVAIKQFNDKIAHLIYPEPDRAHFI